MKIYLWVAFRSAPMRMVNIAYPLLIVLNVWLMTFNKLWVMNVVAIAAIVAIYAILVHLIVLRLQRALFT